MTRDLRRYASQTNFRLIIGLFILLLLIGEGLIYLFYGQGAAAMGLFCLLASLLPVLLVGVALVVLNWIVKRADRD